ncbi:RNA polymerase sigma-70 factor, ECF subfamily [Cyclobacterium lianum]|uniref:RNA polymerase sigma-70 factor, ECF subfamily n=1 Tax=Cyclobacterium lianum TaxID=388280 RepID=A0A1M7NFC2_9BACT|nr:RNA polymerase sigma factor [Cyclobacterium lianum]SHN02398.1 RNA polymerase sigma-70 factor, ECF subfamily [Cyclobacterium lianum]
MPAENRFTEEKDLINACLKGERMAQRELYGQYSGKFLPICIRYVKNRDLAQDVLVEGFMKIFESLPQFKNAGSFEGWMKRIMVNQALLTLRNNKNLRMEVELEMHNDCRDFHTQQWDFGAEELLQIISALPVGYRTVFNLYAIEGYSHREISQMLDISESTSKSQLSRARMILQQKLKPNLQNEEKNEG